VKYFFSGFGLPTARCLIASILLLSVATVPVAAQDGQGRFETSTSSRSKISGQFNVRGTVGVPQGGFENNVSGPGGGLNLFIGGWVGPKSPVMAGLDVGFLRYGNATEQVPFSSTVGLRVPVEVETSNNILETHLSLRLQPRHGRIRPFVKALAGFKYLFTRTSLAEEDFGNDLGTGTASAMSSPARRTLMTLPSVAGPARASTSVSTGRMTRRRRFAP